MTQITVKTQIIKVSSLLKAITAAKKVNVKRLPIILEDYFLIKNGYLIACNLQTQLCTPVDISPDAFFLLPRSIEAMLKPIRKEEISIQKDGDTLTVTTPTGEITYKTPEAATFPLMETDGERTNKTTVTDLHLFASFCSLDELRPAMTGVFISDSQICATDAHVLRWESKEKTAKPHGIIPASVAKLMMGKWDISTIETGISQATDGQTVIFYRAIDARYPDFNAVIPDFSTDSGYTNGGTFQRLELIRALEIAAAQSTEEKRTKKVDISLDKDGASITEYSTQATQTINLLSRDSENAGFFTLRFNPVYMLTILKSLQSETVNIKMQSETRVIVINECCLLMPVLKK